ncbi:hypothetical protein AGMMS50255_4650 [Spirochaetia bacterium]|nr:hypothetical protein AGMMS50255_4650 [Spirochaetia bacterium]
MKKRLVFTVILSMALAFGLVLTGCPTDTGGSDSDPDLSGTITISPDSNVTTGTQLTAAYSGSESGITYQWNKGGIAIATDGTGTSYTTPTAGSYTVTVSAAGYKSKTSDAITVTGFPEYAIGDTGPGGGKIFYVSEFGFTSNSVICHYLEVAREDIPGTKTWASSGFMTTSIPGTSEFIGRGMTNTDTILAADPDAPAAKACKEYNGGGKSDWFLPSFYELFEISSNSEEIGNLSSGNFYWSSSEYEYDNVWIKKLDQIGKSYGSKDNTFLVRPVRAF